MLSGIAQKKIVVLEYASDDAEALLMPAAPEGYERSCRLPGETSLWFYLLRHPNCEALPSDPTIRVAKIDSLSFSFRAPKQLEQAKRLADYYKANNTFIITLAIRNQVQTPGAWIQSKINFIDNVLKEISFMSPMSRHQQIILVLTTEQTVPKESAFDILELLQSQYFTHTQLQSLNDIILIPNLNPLGLEGLLSACNNYHPRHGGPFASFSVTRRDLAPPAHVAAGTPFQLIDDGNL